MKIKLVSRAFYEDAYLDFFLYYYLSIGIDKIVLLKADSDECYNLPKYKLSDNIKKEDIDKIEIINVPNLGNNLLIQYYDVYNDKNYDWVLHIDCDEFLIFDIEKFGNIHNYVNNYLELISNTYNIDSNNVQQLQFRWMCIHKYDNKFIKNDNEYKNYTINNYIENYPLEFFKYTKVLARTKYMKDKPLSYNNSEKVLDIKNLPKTEKVIDPHYFNMNILPDIVNINNKKFKKLNILDNYYVIRYNKCNPMFLVNKKKSCTFGFLLHINTRSLINSITKCLVTKLRQVKQLDDLSEFRNFINNICLNNNNNDKNCKELKNKLNTFLKYKYTFPIKNKEIHKQYIDYLDMNYINNLLLNNINSNKHKYDIKNIPFINIKKEIEIFKILCKKKEIDFEKLMYIVNLY